MASVYFSYISFCWTSITYVLKSPKCVYLFLTFICYSSIAQVDVPQIVSI